mmetsp:Transcript_82192/g.232754  ORF Transcript_82192/g.232754 Transcript_82192/m.232754 type:complete len:213 (-) Transcript_82192:266-904(-)
MEHGVGERGDAEVADVREHLPPWLQEAVARAEVRLDHPFVEKERANGLGDKNVNLALDLVRSDVLEGLVKNLERRPQGWVVVGKLPDDLTHGRSLHGVDVGRAGLCGEEREDAAPRADVHDGSAAEVVRVLDDGPAVRARPDAVLEHVLLVPELCVVLKVALHAALLVLLKTLVVVLTLQEIVHEGLCSLLGLTLQAHLALLHELQGHEAGR